MQACNFGHPLQYTTSDAGCSFSCYRCSRCGESSIACSQGRWACFPCNFSLCTKCANMGMPVPGPMPYPSPAPMPYPVPGPMPYPGPSPMPYPMPGPIPRPMPAPYGSTCPCGHQLMNTNSMAGPYANGMYRCNRCGTIGYCSMYRFHCPTCPYDLCKTCKPY